MVHALKKEAGPYPLYDLADSGQITSYTSELRFGLRWTPVNGERKGLAGKAERKVREKMGLTDPADWDAGAFFLTDRDPKTYMGFGFYTPFEDDGERAQKSVRHSGDSIRGEGSGDDESVEFTLADVPERYDGIILAGGAFKKGSEVDAVRAVKATIYDGSDGTYDAVGEYEPSLLRQHRMIAVAALDRNAEDPKLWSLRIVNKGFDCTPGDMQSALRSLLHLTRA